MNGCSLKSRCARAVRRGGGLLLALGSLSCASGGAAAHDPNVSAPGTALPSGAGAQQGASARPAVEGAVTIALVGDEPVAVPGSPLTAKISGAYHKTRTPLVGVSVLFSEAGAAPRRTELTWRIREYQIDPTWHPLAENRYDAPSGTYVEERIPGWRVRLESIDEESVGGDPTAITISVKAVQE